MSISLGDITNILFKPFYFLLKPRSLMKNSKLKWKCISNCGACCRLAPEERSEALSVLDDDQLKQYLEMVGHDGWCRHYDKQSRTCSIYENRPDFCKVDSTVRLYKIDNNEINNFCISCCKLQIRSIYGGRSLVMKKFLKKIQAN